MDNESISGSCYIVARGPAIEMVEDYLGLFKNKDDAIQYAEYYMSFEATEDVMVFEAEMDRAAPSAFEDEILGDLLDDLLDDWD